MATLNTKNHVTVTPAPKTHGGTPAARTSKELQLQRSVMACMLWENEFYEDGQTIAKRIAELVPQCDAGFVASLALRARTEQKLRHVPLWLVRNMAKGSKEQRLLVADTLAQVVQRADELAEFVALYWKDSKETLSAQVKKGLAQAFTKFDEYQLAKYNRDGAVKLRDVLFLSHAKPKSAEQAELWKRLVDGTLVTPDTWEVELSAGSGSGKKASWERLLGENKLGALALLRNLRNMEQAGVDSKDIRKALKEMDPARVLPFRFITASKYAPKFEDVLEDAMFRSLAKYPKLPGKTVLIVDVSGSMYGDGTVSKHSELTRVDAAAALAMLIREVAEEPVIYCTAGSDGARKHATALVPPRRGFGLANVITRHEMQTQLGGGGIFLTQVMDYVAKAENNAARTIVLTDEQDTSGDGRAYNPKNANAFGEQNYLVNVASAKNGIGYGNWTHIDGWSESVVDYILAAEGNRQ